MKMEQRSDKTGINTLWTTVQTLLETIFVFPLKLFQKFVGKAAATRSETWFASIGTKSIERLVEAMIQKNLTAN